MAIQSVFRIPEDLASIDRPIHELDLPDGRWQVALRRDLAEHGPLVLGPLRLSGEVALSTHVTRTAVPPVGAFVGDAGERATAYVSLLVQGEAAGGVDLSHLPGSGGPAIPTPIGEGEDAGSAVAGRTGGAAAATLRWAQHRRISQDLTLRQALTGLLAGLKDPFDPTDPAGLGPGEVLEVARCTSARATHAATWNTAVVRELLATARGGLELGEPARLAASVAGTVSLTMSLAGAFTLTVESGDRGAGWVRLRLTHRRDDLAGADLRLAASALPRGLDGVARALLTRVLRLPPAGADSAPFRRLVDAVAGWVAALAREGATASLGSALNRTRGREALADLQFLLPQRSAEYLAAACRGDLTSALSLAEPSGQSGIALGPCLLSDHLRRHRTFTLSLRLLGQGVQRETGRLAAHRVTRGSDGALWIEGQAAATVNQRTRRELEELAVVFDLCAVAGAAEPERELSAALHRAVTVSRGRRHAAALARQHLAGAVALHRLDGGRAAALARELAAAPLPYTFRLTAAFPPSHARLLFALDQPGLGQARFRAGLWAVYSAAVRALDLEVPTTDPRRPCPMWLLVTEERIAAIRRSPFLAAEPRRLPPLAADGHRFDQGAPARGFWLHLALAHTFVEALVAARRVLRRSEPGAALGRELSALARVAARLRDQAGWLTGASHDARHLMLPLLVGVDDCDLTLTFSRGDLTVTL